MTSEALEVLHDIRLRIEEARMLKQVKPKLVRSQWFYDKVLTLTELAVECVKIMEDSQ